MPLLYSTDARRKVSRLPGSVPGRRPQIRQHFGPGQRGVVHLEDQAGVHSTERGARDLAAVLLLLRRMSLTTKARNYFVFLWRCARIAFDGDWRYYAWMGLLSIVVLLGINAYARQFVHGLITTGMSDQVSWGVYIANFTFIIT